MPFPFCRTQRAWLSFIWLAVLSIVAVRGASYNFALVRSTAQEAIDFNTGVTALTAARNALNPRGDGSTIQFTTYDPAVLATGMPSTVLAVVGGSFDDAATWQVNYAGNVLFPAAPSLTQLNSTSIWGLAPHLEQIIYKVGKSMMREFATTFGVINSGTPACAAFVAALNTEFDINALAAPSRLAASKDAAADVAAMATQGVRTVISCATTPADISTVANAAIAANVQIFFPFAVTSTVQTALATTSVPDDGVWVPRWLPDITNTSNALVAACRAVATVTSEHVLQGCLAASVIERMVRFIDAPSDESTFRFTANRVATVTAFGFTVGPYTPTCRASTIVECLTYVGGTLVSKTDVPIDPCAIGVATKMQPIIGIQLVWNNTDSIAAADALVAGANAFTANRNIALQASVYIERVLLPTPNGPLPASAAAVFKVMNASYGLGLWGCVDITRQIVEDLDFFSLGRVDGTAVAPSHALNDVGFTARDGLVFNVYEGEVLTAFLFARSAAGRAGDLSLAVAVDTLSGPLWFETVHEALAQYQDAYQMQGAAAFAVTPASLLDTTQGFDFVMYVGAPTVVNAQAVCNLVNNGTRAVLLPQMLADSTTFYAATQACVTQPWNLLLMRDTDPSGATQLGLTGFAARGYTLAALANTLFDLAAPTNRSLYGRPLPVESALFHSSGLNVDDVTFGALTSVPCALAKPGEACECSSASRQRIVWDASGLQALVLQVAPCDIGGFHSASASDKYIKAMIAMCCATVLIAVLAVFISHCAAKQKLAETDDFSNLDPRLVKSVADEVQSVLPLIHRRSRLFLAPFLLVSVGVGLGVILPLHFTLVDRIDTLAVESTSLRSMQLSLECAASFSNFLLPVPSATQIPALRRACEAAANDLQLPTVAQRVNTLLTAAAKKLQSGAVLNSTDIPFGDVICPIAAQSTFNVLKNGADQISLAVAAAAAMSMSVGMGLASYNGVLYSASAFAAGKSSAPLLSTADTSLYRCFEAAYTEFAAVVDSPLIKSFASGAFAASNSGWAVNHVLTCLAGNVATDGLMTLATATCIANVLTTQRLSEVEVTTLMTNWTVPVVDDAMAAVRTATASPQHDDLYRYFIVIWFSVAVSIVFGTFVRASAGRILTASAAQYHDAVMRSKVVEANIARYISVAMLELMDVNSVHEIGGDGVMREVTILHVDYYDALYRAARRLALTKGEMIRRVGQAITTDAGSGRIESVTDMGAIVLFDDAGEAVRCATRIEAAVADVLQGTGKAGGLKESDVDDDDNEDEEEEPSGSSSPGATPLPAHRNSTNSIVGLETPEEASGQVPLICLGLHRDVVAVGFMCTGRYQFPGAHGNGIRVAKRLSAMARRYGARIVATSNVIDTIPVHSHASLGATLRELGPVRGKRFDVALVLEVCTPKPRCRLDEFKPTSVEAMKAISIAQRACSAPATEEQLKRYIDAVSHATQLAQVADVTDPAITQKFLWNGAGPYDDLIE